MKNSLCKNLVHKKIGQSSKDKSMLISNWLALCCFSVVLIVFVGGLTRLTDAGLSITEWKPVTGIFPPISSSDWDAEFARYQGSPEYIKRNFDMNMTEFKFIFWLEFVHRLLGRIAGLLYALPLLYFGIKKYLQGDKLRVHFLVLGLFALQGFMGWYMVKSGLVDTPHVSHFRLAMHLMLAIAIYSLLFWQFMLRNFDILIAPLSLNLKFLSRLVLITLAILYLQIFLGALVAGLDAGLVYNSFPMMGENFIPEEIRSQSFEQFLNFSTLSDPVSVQFLHRINSYLLSFFIVVLAFFLIKIQNPKLYRFVIYLCTILILQMSMGILTIIYSVPIIIALMHQFLAIVLVSILLWGYFLLRI